MGSTTPPPDNVKLDELRRRALHQPSLVIWIGADYQPSAEMVEALAGCRVLGIFNEGQSLNLVSQLQRVPRVDARLPAPVTEIATTESWAATLLPVFYMSGTDRERLAGRQAVRLRMACQGVVADKFAAENPIHILVGYSDGPLLNEAVESVLDADVRTPLFFVDPTGESFDPPDVAKDSPRFGSWSELEAWFRQFQIRLRGEAPPEILYGQTAVELAPIFEDEEVRIEDQFRLIQRRGLEPPPRLDLRRLFDAFMSLDEERRAKDVFSDLEEWWAIAAEIPAVRPSVEACWPAIREELGRAVGESTRVRNIWLPAERAAGCTAALHSLAHRAARAGFPVLVARQQTSRVEPARVNNFLAELARSSGGPELPSLLVLDADHLIEGLAQLPHQLRQCGRPLVMLAAWPVTRGALDTPRMTPAELRSRGAVDAPALLPKDGDVLLPGLRSTASSGDIDALAKKVDELRTRGLDLPTRDVGTWAYAQGRAGLTERFAESAETDDRDRALAWLTAEPLFWPTIYHFLLDGSESDFSRVLKRIESVDPISLPVALEVAKAGNWRIPVPCSLLVSYVQSVGLLDTGDASGQRRPSPLESAVVALKASWDGNAFRRSAGPSSRTAAEQRVRWVIDTLVDSPGIVRTSNFDGQLWVRFDHRTNATHLLAEAARQQHSALSTLGLAWMYDREQAFKCFLPLLNAASATPVATRFAELVSYEILQGDDESAIWTTGGGEERVKAYNELPPELVNASRALLHHQANVLRRSCFWKPLDPATKRDRLTHALGLLDRALTLPWKTGVRDEHPGHIRTTRGLTMVQLAKLESRSAHDAIRVLEQALTEIPDSRHTRLALAQLYLADAQQKVLANLDGGAKAAARVLSLLSVEPTGRIERWTETKRRVVELFGTEQQRQRLDELKKEGREDAFMLLCELSVARGEVGEGIAILREITTPERIDKYWEAARRLAELMLQERVMAFDERRRLLQAVERAADLRPDEAHQLASLELMFGDRKMGMRRFALLRSSGQAARVSRSIETIWTDTVGKPVEFLGRPNADTGAFRSWIRIEPADGSGWSLEVPFIGRHFEDGSRRTIERVAVRLTKMGPQAIPLRMAGRSISRRRREQATT
jgi:hypothetical protein